MDFDYDIKVLDNAFRFNASLADSLTFGLSCNWYHLMMAKDMRMLETHGDEAYHLSSLHS